MILFAPFVLVVQGISYFCNVGRNRLARLPRLGRAADADSGVASTRWATRREQGRDLGLVTHYQRWDPRGAMRGAQRAGCLPLICVRRRLALTLRRAAGDHSRLDSQRQANGGHEFREFAHEWTKLEFTNLIF
jgi:hypothetical protein